MAARRLRTASDACLLLQPPPTRAPQRAIASGSLPSIYCPCDPGRFPTPEQAKHVPQWHELRDWSLRAGNEGGARPPWASPIPKISTADAGTAEASPAPPTPVLRVSRLKSKPFGGRGYTSQFRGVHQTMPTGAHVAVSDRSALGCLWAGAESTPIANIVRHGATHPSLLQLATA